MFLTLLSPKIQPAPDLRRRVFLLKRWYQ